MKSKRSSPARRARSTISRKASARRRPIHKRVLLHPFTAFLLLCAGVLTIGSTFRGQAASYDVTATVPAPAVTSPAVITEPGAGQHVGTESIIVRGTCPPQSYVQVYRASVLSGAAICSSGQFAVQATLIPGGNELHARVFNLTDNEGPASSPLTVFYDLPITIPAPAAVPVGLTVANVERETYAQGKIEEVGSSPTVSGYAPPFSAVVVTFYSEPSVCKTKTNGLGQWSCTLLSSLPPGLHRVVIEATTVAGEKLTLPTFQVKVVNPVESFSLLSESPYQARRQGQPVSWVLGMRGGTAPFVVVADWGDGSTSRFAQADWTDFEITHTYNTQSSSDTDYAVLATATDARGATSKLQVTATIKAVAALFQTNPGAFDSVFASVRQWLWVVWPAYIAVVFMAVSFWIGEREAYQRFMARRRITRGRR